MAGNNLQKIVFKPLLKQFSDFLQDLCQGKKKLVQDCLVLSRSLNQDYHLPKLPQDQYCLSTKIVFKRILCLSIIYLSKNFVSTKILTVDEECLSTKDVSSLRSSTDQDCLKAKIVSRPGLPTIQFNLPIMLVLPDYILSLPIKQNYLLTVIASQL